MKKDTELWLRYAEENLRSAEVLLDSGLFNPSLHNSQQAVEKLLKAVLIENAAGLIKSHSIRELVGRLEVIPINHPLTDDDIDLLDSIFLPSKYPVFSVLPNFMPDAEICRQCIEIAKRVQLAIELSIH